MFYLFNGICFFKPIAILLTMLLVNCNEVVRDDSNKSTKLSLLYKFSAIVLLLVIVIILWNLLKTRKRNPKLIRVISLSNICSVDEIVQPLWKEKINGVSLQSLEENIEAVMKNANKIYDELQNLIQSGTDQNNFEALISKKNLLKSILIELGDLKNKFVSGASQILVSSNVADNAELCSLRNLAFQRCTAIKSEIAVFCKFAEKTIEMADALGNKVIMK